jgi:biotin operon repressor
MATCAERIMNHMRLGKQMSIDDLARAIKHGRNTVKSSVLILKKEGYIKIAAYKRTYNSTTPTHIYAWTGKEPAASTDPKAQAIALSNKNVLAALSRHSMLSVIEIMAETTYSESVVRRAIKELRELDKVRIAGWRLQRGASVTLWGLFDGRPDAVLVKGELKVERRKKAIEQPQRTTIVPRRDPAAAWF